MRAGRVEDAVAMPACRAGVVERGRVVVAAELRGKVDVSAPPVQPLSWKVQRPASIWMRCCLSLAHAADFVPFALALAFLRLESAR